MHKTALKLLKHPNNDQYYKVAIVKLFTQHNWIQIALAFFSKSCWVFFKLVKGERNESNRNQPRFIKSAKPLLLCVMLAKSPIIESNCPNCCTKVQYVQDWHILQTLEEVATAPMTPAPVAWDLVRVWREWETEETSWHLEDTRSSDTRPLVYTWTLCTV